jgi:hypothetical protein
VHAPTEVPDPGDLTRTFSVQNAGAADNPVCSSITLRPGESLWIHVSAEGDFDDAFVPETLPRDRNPVQVLLASRTWDNSRRSYARSLQLIADLIGRWTGRTFTKETLPWWQLSGEHVAKIRRELLACSDSESARIGLSHLRSLLGVCHRLGLTGADQHSAARSAAEL